LQHKVLFCLSRTINLATLKAVIKYVDSRKNFEVLSQVRASWMKDILTMQQKILQVK